TDELTRAQWRSVRRLIDELPDSTAVYPTHGFGSFCSSSGGADRDHTTIGQEADDNIAATTDDVDAFVEELLAGLSDHPAYYAHMSLLNRAGAFEPDLGEPERVEADELADRLVAGEWVLDLRNRRAYAERHLVGSAGFELDGPFVTYVGWLIPWGARITLIGESSEQIADAQRELVRIGIDHPHAAVGAIDELATPNAEVASYPIADFAELATTDGATVVDVRRRDEWDDGHIEGAHHIAIHELLDHLHHVPDGRLWVHCASGARASIAASLLARAGHDVVLIDDSFEHAERAGVPVTSAS
ncbi:MAG: MBL fold metallo-hydrolase, partial [Ilumatobacter sp.]|nr:MBL fold metallo-hydrolase [Ilumatobacter sp.]